MANGLDFRNEFIRRTGRIGKLWGIGEPVGKVWGLLILENRPLTQREIAEQIDCSLSLVSPSLTIMEQIGMISVVGSSGREKQYGAVVSFINTFEKLLGKFVEAEINPLITLLYANYVEAKDAAKKEHLDKLIKEYKKTTIILNELSKIVAAKKGLSFEQLQKGGTK